MGLGEFLFQQPFVPGGHLLQAVEFFQGVSLFGFADLSFAKEGLPDLSHEPFGGLLHLLVQAVADDLPGGPIVHTGMVHILDSPMVWVNAASCWRGPARMVHGPCLLAPPPSPGSRHRASSERKVSNAPGRSTRSAQKPKPEAPSVAAQGGLSSPVRDRAGGVSILTEEDIPGAKRLSP